MPRKIAGEKPLSRLSGFRAAGVFFCRWPPGLHPLSRPLKRGVHDLTMESAMTYPASANLFHRLAASIADPAKTAIVAEGSGKISYADLVALTGRIANHLVARGLKPGDRVAVQIEKNVTGLALYLATVRAGGVYLPLNSAYTPAELDYFLTDAAPAILVCDPSSVPSLEPCAVRIGASIETLDHAGRGSLDDGAALQSPEFATVARDGDDLAAILYTSGTTGRSKGAMLTHDNLVSNAITLIDVWRFTPDDVLIHTLPIYHTHGLFVASNVALFSGATMIFRTKFDAGDVLALMPRASVLMGVPTFYTRLLQQEKLTREATASMRLFISGSAPLLAETHRAWEARTGHAILERYGMTETGMNTSNPYDGPRVPGSVGFALPGVELRVVDAETGAPLGADQVGMIEVKGPNVFKGYWRMPEKTAAEFRSDGFFITGDVGRVDALGYIHLVGRGKDIVITGGLNVYPTEVETEIDALTGVLESAVIGLPHADLGEGVAAVVVRDRDAATSEADILTGLAGRLAKFKQPKRVFFVDELPRNTMGKVQKNVLRDRFGDAFGAG
jgi:malonyl-CoA/methylmalonyl-CoA synthetase